jgi:S1-C subfamily serine protease
MQIDEKNGPEERPVSRIRSTLRRLRSFIPFAFGIFAALIALLLYNAFYPSPAPTTKSEIDEAIAEAMASATQPAAYSARVFQVIQPSLVLIQAQRNQPGEEWFGSIGSGVVITDMGDILTSLHVVEGASEIRVTFADGTQTTAYIAAAQPEIDIAVLQTVQLPALLVPAVLGNPNAMSIGDEAYAVGNPFGLFGSMSAGVISGFNRSFQVPESELRLEGLIQIDTAVNPGNSGGPLLNREGHVVGIVVGILNPVDQEFFVGIGFAVPITTASGAVGAAFY